jgi:HEAT repeats
MHGRMALPMPRKQSERRGLPPPEAAPPGLTRRLTATAILSALMLTGGGCGTSKSTEDLLNDLKSPHEHDRVIAVRLLQRKKDDAAKVVPALTESLKDKDDNVRCSAAIGLGYFHEQARDAIPALQEAQHDSDPRVREAAGVALSRIDPSKFPAKPLPHP